MKRILAFILIVVLCYSVVACGTDRSNTNVSDNQETTENNSNTDANDNQGTNVPNNGEWDEILCSGDTYYLVKKEIDAYDGYKFMLGVVNADGEWVQELTDTGTFAENVRFRAEGSSETLRDSSCYAYLGEGVFIASPGASVYTKNSEQRIGPWENFATTTPTGRVDVAIWECIIWNVIDNVQVTFDASKISTFNDGYLLFCKEDEFGGGYLRVMNKKGEITELPCKYLPMKPMHNFPVYSEGLFYANTEGSNPGFFDIEGNLVIDLSEYDVGRIPYSSSLGINAPYFHNGEATILFANNADSVFKVNIDNSGNFIGEPEKVNIPKF